MALLKVAGAWPRWLCLALVAIAQVDPDRRALWEGAAILVASLTGTPWPPNEPAQVRDFKVVPRR